jgi:hypothetical protein
MVDFKKEMQDLWKMPVIGWVVVIAAGITFAFNIAMIISMPWKLDQGMATLVGAVVGLGIIAYQTRIGFRNLIASQANQSTLDREAREHQAALDDKADERATKRQKENLLSAIRAEIISLHEQACTSLHTVDIYEKLYTEMVKAKAPATSKAVAFKSFDAIVFKQNIAHIGLLGPSLGGDVIKVLSIAQGKPMSVELENKTIPNEIVASLYGGHAEHLRDWIDDLYHVAMRIRSVEENTPDPGTLTQTQKARREKSKKP